MGRAGRTLAVYVAFLTLAVITSYTRGPGLMRSVIWDPVTLYTFVPSDQAVMEHLRAGFFPLWDASRGLGTSHVLPSGWAVDHPLKLLAWSLPAAIGWEVYLLLRFLLAGLFAHLGAREAGLGPRGAFLAGLSYMLCGYFREYHNQESVNVEFLFPLFFLFIARAARRPTIGALLGVFLTSHFMIANPESTVYSLAYAFSFFFLQRTAAMLRRKARGPAVLAMFALPLCMLPIGFLTRTDSVLGFLEYHHRSWIFHPKGLGELAFPLSSAIGLVTPIFDYWFATASNLDQPHFEQLSLVPAYLGTITFILAAAAIIHPRKLSVPGLFFAAVTLALLGLVFGLPGFALLAKFPLIRYFQNFRYAQPYLAFSTAMLAGMGLELLLPNKARSRPLAVIVGLTALWIVIHLLIFRRQIASTELIRAGLLAAGIAAIVLAAATAWAWRRFPGRRAAVIAVALIAANGLELALYFNLAMPLFGPGAFNIAEPPGARFLAERGPKPFRIFATDQRILHPNLAGMSGLSDLRNHTPLEIRDYARLFSAANGWNTPDQMVANFLADGKFYFDIEWDRWPPELLDLLNVRYVLAYHDPRARPLLPPGSDFSALTREPRYVSQSDLAVSGVFRTGTIAHAPARLEAPLGRNAGGRMAMEAAVLDTAAQCPDTDGVTLAAFLQTARGARLVYARTVKAERDPGWKPFEPGLSGDEKALVLASLPGPNNDERCDFGAWARPWLRPPIARDPAGNGLALIYDREFQIYENINVLPRVFAAEKIRVQPDRFAFIAELRGADPRQTAWVELDEGLAETSFAPAAVTAVEEGFNRLGFRAGSASPSFIVISNLFYPGWRAYAAGHEVRVQRVDGLLQGLLLPAGDHEVFMAFIPVSFRIGLWAHLAGLAMLGLMAALASRGRIRYHLSRKHGPENP